MKKYLYFPMFFILGFSLSNCVLAESDMDFTNYTMEELISLRASVDAEIENRTSELSTTLIPGSYVVGVDLKSGSYILQGLMEKGPDGYTPQALVAESKDDAEYSDYSDYKYLETGEKWRIAVDNGNVIEIRSGDISVQAANPLACGVEDNNPIDESLTITSNLVPGRYIVGKDIKAGTYILLGLMDEGPNGYTPQALVAESIDDALYDEYIDYDYLKTGETWRINLQELLCRGWFLPPNTYDCGSFVVNGTAVVGKE